MRVLCLFGRYNYGDPSRGEGYEYANFIPTLRRLGHEVLFMDSWDRTRHGNFRELNEALLHLVEDKRPQVVLTVSMHYEIWLETWEILREAGIAATLNWTTDDSWKYPQFSRLLAPSLHAFTTTYAEIYARYRRDGLANVLLTQWGADAAKAQPPLAAAACPHQVTFIGTAYGKRRAWIRELHRRGVMVTCFGQGWPGGPVPAAAIPGIIRGSLISLNFADGTRHWKGLRPRTTRQIKARTFEVPGAGGFLLTEWVPGLERCYQPEREIGVFGSVADLAEKIRYYLAHPALRDELAWAGYRRTLREHLYDRRLAEALAFAEKQRDEYFQRSGLEPSGRLNWVRFAAAARSHVPVPHLNRLRRALIPACIAIWGRVRGPRAARRLIFELSWRLAGRHTYSAAGWPGRMFYRES